MGARESKGAGKGSKKGAGGGGPTTLQYGMKFLAPEVLASAIIGKGGAVIAEMRTSCQSQLALTDKGEFYPSTDCRVLTAQAMSLSHSRRSRTRLSSKPPNSQRLQVMMAT